MGSEPGGGIATYIGFCSGYFGRCCSPQPSAPSPPGVRYFSAAVLGVCITFSLPGPIKPINNLGPCLPAEAQARLSSSMKPSMTTSDGSNASVLQNPAREGRGRRAKGWNGDCLPCMGWAGLLYTCQLTAASPFRPGPARMDEETAQDVRSCRVYTQSRGPGAGVDGHSHEMGSCLAGSPALRAL